MCSETAVSAIECSLKTPVKGKEKEGKCLQMTRAQHLHGHSSAHTDTRVAAVSYLKGFHCAFVRFSPPLLPPYREKIKHFSQGNQCSVLL